MSVFSHVFGMVFCILCAIPSCVSGSFQEKSGNITRYMILCEEKEVEDSWGSYLAENLKKRSDIDNIAACNGDIAGCKIIRIILEKGDYDYALYEENGDIYLKASNDENMIWLMTQFIDLLAQQDKRIDVTDLPPAYIRFSKEIKKFDFDYREPFFPTNLKSGYASLLGTHTVDINWGLWGHNLHKIIGDDVSESLYAYTPQGRKYDQYCFSSEDIYRYIEDYIMDNYGDSQTDATRFMIMPNDNPVVCLCSLCKKNGNLPGNATPAVAALIRRLATRYPSHFFFTTAYITTLYPEGVVWPSNTGVMISTIEIPKGGDPATMQQGINFRKQIQRWRQYTPIIYVWDYAANFDDYLTPVPVLYGLQKQLQFYRLQGIDGVFLNASGYDYSTAEDMKTFVASALMKDSSLPVDSLCYLFYNKFYPVTGKVLADYYLQLEKQLEAGEGIYEIYGDFFSSICNFLDKEKFLRFYDELGTLLSGCDKEERRKVDKLYTALTFTRLRVAWVDKDMETARQLMPRLADYTYFPEMNLYKEDGATLEQYLSNWHILLNYIQNKNLFSSLVIRPLSRLDKGYTDVTILNDGMCGFAGDYQQGWFLCGGNDLHLAIEGEIPSRRGVLSIRFLSHPRHRIHPPEKIEVYKNGELYRIFSPVRESWEKRGTGIWVITERIDLTGANALSIKMKRGEEDIIIACDEIKFN